MVQAKILLLQMIFLFLVAFLETQIYKQTIWVKLFGFVQIPKNAFFGLGTQIVGRCNVTNSTPKFKMLLVTYLLGAQFRLGNCGKFTLV